MKNKTEMRKIFVIGLVMTLVLSGTIFLVEAKDNSKPSIDGGDSRNLTGNYYILSIPSGASIYLDSMYKGKTPKYISNVTMGNHTVLLKKTGYQDWSRTEYLHPGQTIVYNVTLISLLSLQLIAPDQVWENTLFKVTVISGCLPVPNATVSWLHYGTSFTADSNGTAWVQAPAINETNITTDVLQAWKAGYLPDSKLIIIRQIVLGDVDGDGNLSFADINPFVFAETHSEIEFALQYPSGDYWAADVNQDGSVDFGDINPFVALFSSD